MGSLGWGARFTSLWNSKIASSRSSDHDSALMERLTSSENPNFQVLKRTLGPIDLVLLGVGASIGSGIFVLTGVAAIVAGPGVVLSFAIAGLACVLDALCYAELSSHFSGLVGGAYLYARSTFGALPGLLLFYNLMFDYHIGAATIARSLSSHLSTLLTDIFPSWETNVPAFFTPGGVELLGGTLSLDIWAPLFLAGLTVILCQGVRESSALNGVMTCLKILIVLLVIVAGAFYVTPSNWDPFLPNGWSGVLTEASVVFFAYVGFDAVANSAEEAKNPEVSLPIGIIGSLGICTALYIGVCLILTGMIPYSEIDSTAPLASAFAAKGLKSLETVIDVGAIVGLTTTLLAGLYVQARLYVALARDGMLPANFASINSEHHTPVKSQFAVGIVAAVLAIFFDVSSLSNILSIGVLASYSMVCACVVVLRIDNTLSPTIFHERYIHFNFERKQEAILLICFTSVLTFVFGICTRWSSTSIPAIIIFVMIIAVISPLFFRQRYIKARGFSCPFVPLLPMLGLCFNLYLVAQMHVSAWIRLVVVTFIAFLVYSFYGKYSVSEGEEGRGEGDGHGVEVDNQKDIVVE